MLNERIEIKTNRPTDGRTNWVEIITKERQTVWRMAYVFTIMSLSERDTCTRKKVDILV